MSFTSHAVCPRCRASMDVVANTPGELVQATRTVREGHVCTEVSLKIYSDKLTTLALQSAALSAGLHLERCDMLARPRLRKYAWEVMVGNAYSRRHHNTGNYGAGDEGAASWDEWGRFLAILYIQDYSMIAGAYKDASDFLSKTGRKYGPLREDQEEHANLHAALLPATRDQDEADTLYPPAVRIAGALVFTYVRDGYLRVSIDLEEIEPWVTRLNENGEPLVPIHVTCQGETIWRTSPDGTPPEGSGTSVFDPYMGDKHRVYDEN